MLTKADITLIRSLSDKRVRVETGLFVVEGRKMVEEALASDFEVRRVLGLPEYGGIACCESVTSKELERMSHLKTPPGVLALVEIPRWRLSDNPGRELALALDDVQDPGNLGTILRTADALEIPAVLLEGCADPYGPKAVRATMGAIFRAPPQRASRAELVAQCRQKGIPLVAAALTPTALDLRHVPLADAAVVIGSEGRGICPELLAQADQTIIIPMNPRCESLNAATAAAILLWQMKR